MSQAAKCLGAFTTMADTYPGYVNVSEHDDSSIVVTTRGDPTVRDGCYVCGHPGDKGKPGRCTPGDEFCNNYCNMAPQKGPMQDAPKDCTQVVEGETVTVRLTSDEWRALLAELSNGG